MDILYLEGKSPLLMSNIQVNFGDILPETSKSSPFWDMGVDCHLKWLLLFSFNVSLHMNVFLYPRPYLLPTLMSVKEPARPMHFVFFIDVLNGIKLFVCIR